MRQSAPISGEFPEKSVGKRRVATGGERVPPVALSLEEKENLGLLVLSPASAVLVKVVLETAWRNQFQLF